MKILQYHETEMGKTIRQTLEEKFAVPCKQEIAPTRMDVANFIAPHYALYSYVRPSNGETLYLLEIELFTPPDAQWWRSWVMDARPTDEQIITIVADDLQPGSVL